MTTFKVKVKTFLSLLHIILKFYFFLQHIITILIVFDEARFLTSDVLKKLEYDIICCEFQVRAVTRV
mgnify:CR=1 FL=1